MEKLMQYKKQLLLLAGCFLLLAICFLVWLKFFNKDNAFIFDDKNKIEHQNDASSTPQEPLWPRKLDGVGVKEGDTDSQIAAVMIDNHPLARPQSGLSRASIVYEAEAEGGITRFLAVYDIKDDISEIGPVRSSRAYYLDWSEEYKALYVHCGGSPEALAKIESDNIKNLNEFYNGKYFWRDEQREAPHNIMVSTQNIRQAIEDKGIKKVEYGIWDRLETPERSASTASGTSIGINYNLNFTVSWDYDIINRKYSRSYNGIVHKDKTGEEIKTDNVIVQVVRSEVIDEKLRMQFIDVGSGEALVCLSGKCIEGKWIKTGTKSRTYFFDETNAKLKLNPGITWIEIVNNKNKIIF